MSLPLFADLVAAELVEARKAHPPMRNLHEGYAVLLEEVEEFWAEVRKKRRGDLGQVVTELAQIGAMAQRIAEDVLRYGPEQSPFV